MSIERIVRTLVWRAMANLWRTILRRFGPYRTYRGDGYPRIVVATEGVAPKAEEIVAAALTLIERVDQARYRRLLSDIRAVVVVDLSPATVHGWYAAGLRCCLLSAATVLPKSETALALTIVHEGVHARLDRLRPWPWGHTRRRMEVRAIREEMAFTARISESMVPGIAAWAGDRWAATPYASWLPELAGNVT